MFSLILYVVDCKLGFIDLKHTYTHTYKYYIPKKRFSWIYKDHETQLAEEEMLFLEESPWLI